MKDGMNSFITCFKRDVEGKNRNKGIEQNSKKWWLTFINDMNLTI